MANASILTTTNCRGRSNGMKEMMGFTLLSLGVATANGANSVLIPIAFAAVGLWLMRGMRDDKSAED